MGGMKVRTSSKSKRSSPRKMNSPSPGVSNLTALLQSTNTSTGSAAIVRCPSPTLSRLRQLNPAEWITLFTPVVPHPPSTLLAKNMDPFEPLGRALARHVRHVPYRLDNGMTETHGDFLASTGAIIIVVCATENVINQHARAFDQQAKFTRDLLKKKEEYAALAHVPAIVLLITNGSGRQAHEDGFRDIPALVTCNNYTTSALANAVRVIFGN